MNSVAPRERQEQRCGVGRPRRGAQVIDLHRPLLQNSCFATAADGHAVIVCRLGSVQVADGEKEKEEEKGVSR